MRYKLFDKIGEGNFADVFMCKLQNTESQFAMKVMEKEKLKSQKQKNILENEIAIMSVCHQKNIVRLIEFMETQAEFYIGKCEKV